MEQWQPAGVALQQELAAGVGAQPWSGPKAPLVPAPSPGGTGGKNSIGTLYSRAMKALAGNWGRLVVAAILYAVATQIVGLICQPWRETSQTRIGTWFSAAAISLLVTGPILLGITTFCLSLARGVRPSFSLLLTGFRLPLLSIGTELLRTLFVMLWMLLLIVPGIMATFSYALTFYLIADNPSLTPLAAIRSSKQMMRGHRWKLFLIYLPWWVLTMALPVIMNNVLHVRSYPLQLVMGLLSTLLWSFVGVVESVFYDDLKPAAVAAVPVIAQP